MSEINSSPLIFSQQEVEDRFQLHRFIHKLFEPCKTGKGDLIGLPADELYHIYSIQHPNNVLTSAITSNMLLTGGFVEQEDPEQSVLYADLNESIFLGLQKEAQMKLLPYIKDPMAIRFRQILLGIRIVNKQDIVINPEFTIKAFVEMWTLNRQNADSYMQSLSTEHRSSATDVYDYYRIICSIYRWPIAERNMFSNILVSLGHPATKGRVYGKAGMRYYKNLYIPQTIEDKILSVEMNMCCMFNGTTHWTSNGILENSIEAQREAICEANLERMGFDEQERQKIKEEKAKLDLRRTFETGEVPLGKAKAANETKDHMGHNGGSEQESETTETETAQDESVGSSSRTSGFKEDRDNSAAQYNPVEAPAFYEPRNDGETYRDRYAQFCSDTGSTNEDDDSVGTDDEDFGEDTGEGDGPSIEQIASALAVPYSMSVATGFTKEVMLNWLKTMKIPEPESVLEHYDEIMEILTQ